MPLHSIHPETLKQYRKHAYLSQQGLAELSRVSKKTIARIEGGKAKANSNTVKCLAKTLNVTPEDLAKPFIKKDRNDQVLDAIGYRKLGSPFIHENAFLAGQMVEKVYGIDTRLQLLLAPLMTALVAEESLDWRRQKLKKVEDSLLELEGSDKSESILGMGLETMSVLSKIEKRSIEERDIFGDVTSIDHKEGGSTQIHDLLSVDSFPNPEEVNPFLNYLSHVAKKSGGLIKILSLPSRYDPHLKTDEVKDQDDKNPLNEWLTNSFNLGGGFADGGISFSINTSELDCLVGDSEWAARALKWGCVKISDIPEELLGDDAFEERVTWLKDQIPQERIDFLEKPLSEKDLLLRKVAEAEALRVSSEDKNYVPKQPTQKEPIPDWFLDILVTRAGDELGSELTQNQIDKIGKWFAEAVHDGIEIQ